MCSIINEDHNTVLRSYLGSLKTYDSAIQRYWWPELYTSISPYVRASKTCQKVKSSVQAASP